MDELTDALLKDILRARRRTGTVPLDRIVIERPIIDPRSTPRSVIDGDPGEAA